MHTQDLVQEQFFELHFQINEKMMLQKFKLVEGYSSRKNLLNLINPLRAKQFVSQSSNSAMARSVVPILKLRLSLERKFYALSFESNLNEEILNVSEVISKRMTASN